MKEAWATLASAAAMIRASQVDRRPTTRICQSENTSVTGQSTAHNQTGSLYQNNWRSSVFFGSMFRSSTPNWASRPSAIHKKRNGPAIHHPPYTAARATRGKTARDKKYGRALKIEGLIIPNLPAVSAFKLLESAICSVLSSIPSGCMDNNIMYCTRGKSCQVKRSNTPEPVP